MSHELRRLFLLVLWVGLVTALLNTAGAETLPPDSYSQYLGTYEFNDGSRVTGGRMDEGGATRLLYIDTESVERAGIFEQTEKGFVPAFDLGDVRRVAFEDDGRVMLWHESPERILRAQRVMHPETRPAAFSNGDLVLEGTLHFPPDARPSRPAVVLAHGSGPATRHAGPWITFFVEQGFAVLAYDKRGTGESGGNWQASTYLDLAEDLSAAVDWVRQQEGIDGNRVGVQTSSQSGWYGPYTARANPGIRFLIQRAAPAVDIGVGTAHEIREEWRAEGLNADAIEPAEDFWLELHELAGRHGSLERAQELLGDARDEPWFEPTFGDWDQIDSGWWERHVANMQLEPAEDAANLSIPVLWFLAEEDQNVPYAESLEALEAATDANPELSVVTVHDAPHSFVLTNDRGDTRYTDEYWQVMAAWLAEKGAAAPSR